jgi:hypothetical protein
MCGQRVKQQMAAFLLGVGVGWVTTFALWFVWSFGWISGLVLGSCIGTLSIFAFLFMHWVPEFWAAARNDNRSPIAQPARQAARKAAFRS